MVSNVLATVDDEVGRPYCDDARKSYEQLVLNKEDARSAGAATAAAIEDLRR